MKPSWQIAKPELLDQINKDIQSECPNFHLMVEGDIVFIRGSYPVIHEGEVLDRYTLEIEFPRDYPESVPIVRETEGRIPRTADYHMMGKKGEACLFVPDERWLVWPPDATFLDFLKGPVYNYFLGQTLVSLGEPWPFGQRSHGLSGIKEFYAELLGTDDFDSVVRYLEYLSKPKIKGHWPCPCGSGNKIRHCHSIQLRDLSSKVSNKIALKMLERLQKKG